MHEKNHGRKKKAEKLKARRCRLHIWQVLWRENQNMNVFGRRAVTLRGKQVNGVTWEQPPGVLVQLRYHVLSSHSAAFSVWLKFPVAPLQSTEILECHLCTELLLCVCLPTCCLALDNCPGRFSLDFWGSNGSAGLQMNTDRLVYSSISVRYQSPSAVPRAMWWGGELLFAMCVCVWL